MFVNPWGYFAVGSIIVQLTLFLAIGDSRSFCFRFWPILFEPDVCPFLVLAVAFAGCQEVGELVLAVQHSCSNPKEPNAAISSRPKQRNPSNAQALGRLFLRK